MREQPTQQDETKLLEQLRDYIVAPDRERIRRLEAELRSPERIVARGREYLPRVVKACWEKDQQLTWSLQPTLEASIRQTVRERREEFAEAIYPVIGPSIARAIRTAVAEMLQRLNEALATRLSLESLRWRVEAARSGRPFAEVVILRTLVYRVEQVLWVERKSGLLLGHMARDEVPVREPAMVSSLLTALNTFASEAFEAKKGLERMEVGDLSVWIETGTQTMLAAVVRGNPPASLGETLHRSLDRAQLEFAGQLERFSGDVSSFERARPVLAECLREERRVPSRERARRLGVGILLGLLLIASLWIALSVRSVLRFGQQVAALRAEPGLVVISAGRRVGPNLIEGLRDPLARSPAEVLSANGFEPRNVETRFTAFQSLDPAILARHVRTVLEPPPGVRLAFAPGEVKATGRAPQAWIFRARTVMNAFKGTLAFSTQGLFSTESAQVARSAAEQLSTVAQAFRPGDATVLPAFAEATAQQALVFLEAAERAGMTPSIVLRGSADEVGTEQTNLALARRRAENLRAALILRGAPAERIEVRQDRPIGRREVRIEASLAEEAP